MKIAYLILAHKNFEQLSLMVNQLAHPDVSFIIHIDAKAEESVVKENFNRNADVHILENRIAVNWGGFSVFRGIFYLLAKAESACAFAVMTWLVNKKASNNFFR
jgi:hypothetical protein